MVPSGHHGGKRDIGKCPRQIGRALRRVSVGHVSLDGQHTSRTRRQPFYGRRGDGGVIVGGANRRTHVVSYG
jgi:hypothetical protein